MAIQIQSDLPATRESWLSRDRLGRERQIAAGGWKTYVGFYNQAAAHRAERPHGGCLHIAPEVTSCPLLPHSRDI
jgi:hypothetical protein